MNSECTNKSKSEFCILTSPRPQVWPIWSSVQHCRRGQGQISSLTCTLFVSLSVCCSHCRSGLQEHLTLVHKNRYCLACSRDVSRQGFLQHVQHSHHIYDCQIKVKRVSQSECDGTRARRFVVIEIVALVCHKSVPTVSSSSRKIESVNLWLVTGCFPLLWLRYNWMSQRWCSQELYSLDQWKSPRGGKLGRLIVMRGMRREFWLKHAMVPCQSQSGWKTLFTCIMYCCIMYRCIMYRCNVQETLLCIKLLSKTGSTPVNNNWCRSTYVETELILQFPVWDETLESW